MIFAALIAATITGVTIDAILPWNLGIGMLFSIITFLASTGFFPQWYLSGGDWTQNTKFADIHLHLKRRHFVTAAIGRWYVPHGIATKLGDMYRCGGRYVWKSGDIHLNLPVISSWGLNDNQTMRELDVGTVDSAVESVIEHEAIHSAIHSCSGDIYNEVRDEFRSKFRQSGLLGKAQIFLKSAPFHSAVGGNEEWAVDTLQRSAREIPVNQKNAGKGDTQSN